MIGRRTAVEVLLLCALVFSAIAVQSASAVQAGNTTAFTCIEGATEDFSDPHCDKKVTPPTGPYGHSPITPGETIEIRGTNETTGGATSPAVTKGKVFGAALEITCNTTAGDGLVHNIHDATGPKHTFTGFIVKTLTNCSVQKPAKCAIKEPIEMEMNFEGVEGLGAEKNEMGVEFKPTEGSTLAQLTFENKGAEKCALAGKTVNVEGTMIATGAPAATEKHTGATSVFAGQRTKETLTIGGVAAEFDSVTTVRRKGGNPISITTVT